MTNPCKILIESNWWAVWGEGGDESGFTEGMYVFVRNVRIKTALKLLNFRAKLLLQHRRNISSNVKINSELLSYNIRGLSGK
jgi:hypothetical protein